MLKNILRTEKNFLARCSSQPDYTEYPEYPDNSKNNTAFTSSSIDKYTNCQNEVDSNHEKIRFGC